MEASEQAAAAVAAAEASRRVSLPSDGGESVHRAIIQRLSHWVSFSPSCLCCWQRADGRRCVDAWPGRQNHRPVLHSFLIRERGGSLQVAADWFRVARGATTSTWVIGSV